MDFSYPQEAEQFRKELRSWLSERLSDDVIDAGTRRGSDDAAFETLRSWNATITWEHDAHLYLKRLLSFSRFLGSAGSYQERLVREMASTT